MNYSPILDRSHYFTPGSTKTCLEKPLVCMRVVPHVVPYTPVLCHSWCYTHPHYVTHIVIHTPNYCIKDTQDSPYWGIPDTHTCIPNTPAYSPLLEIPSHHWNTTLTGSNTAAVGMEWSLQYHHFHIHTNKITQTIQWSPMHHIKQWSLTPNNT